MYDYLLPRRKMTVLESEMILTKAVVIEALSQTKAESAVLSLT